MGILFLCKLSFISVLISVSETRILLVAQDLKLEPARIFAGARYIDKKNSLSEQQSTDTSAAIQQTCETLLPTAHPDLIAVNSESYHLELGIPDKSIIVSSSGFVVRIVTNGKLRNGMHAFILQARDASKVGAMNAFGTFTGLVLANETVEGIYMPVRCSGRIGDTMIWTTGTAAGCKSVRVLWEPEPWPLEAGASKSARPTAIQFVATVVHVSNDSSVTSIRGEYVAQVLSARMLVGGTLSYTHYLSAVEAMSLTVIGAIVTLLLSR